MGINHLQPPFDNEKVRQAVLLAVDQRDYMAGGGRRPEYWKTCYSVYTCGTPYASEAGAEPLKRKRDLERRRRCCARPATTARRSSSSTPPTTPAAHAEALVTADLLRRLGMNVELQASDWGTVLTRRARKSPVGEGGWSIFHTSFDGPGAVDPSINLGLRADGEKAWFGWPTDDKLEALKRDVDLR